jgi:hypothetical protein
VEAYIDITSIKWPELRKLIVGTLRMLESENLLRPASERAYRSPENEWFFLRF